MDRKVLLFRFLVELMLIGSFATAYDNIAFNKTAWQQYPYPFFIFQWGADKAVDGQFTNRAGSGGQCTISDNEKYNASWWVDLGGVLSIHHINIFYRTDNFEWGPRNGYTSRFLGFSIYISNTTDKDEGILCFKDTNYTRATIPDNVTIECVTHGRYIIYYNERLPGVTNPDGYSKYAHNELCEVEVFECDNNRYGLECNMTCGNCTKGEQCDHVNGSCPNKYDAGARGEKGDKECFEGSYGYDCLEMCHINCGDTKRCDSKTGECENGCQTGWMGAKCDKECDGGTYGQNCAQSCGVCFDKEQCHHINGTCLNGCDRGYQRVNCTQACPEGRFDYNCRQKCNINCRSDGKCDVITGQCKGGCLTGWQGERCDRLIDIYFHPDQSTPCCSYLYGVLAILCLSLILNIFLIFRSYRNKRNKRKNHKEKNTKVNSQENILNTEIYDKVEDNAGYQELGQLSQPSHYDKLN
ncbi:multiple epidermal growth factor-like domains protein 10 isoform X2 [Saccostrea cucullata]|uniref:multiple epidermal growth factor-like domains protein 10 isoform X2 n=1 Tax=Saccostrea cuccullata TaxID=36930 RepID=UPI002ED3CD45